MKHLLDSPEKKGDFLNNNPVISKSTYYGWKKNSVGHDILVYELAGYLRDSSWIIEEDA